MTSTTSSELARAWTERVRSGAFSPAVAGTREVRVFGQAGDARVVFPQLRALAPGETPELVIELLEPDERWALQHAERVVTTHQQAGRLTAEVVRGRADGEVMPALHIDPLKATDFDLVLAIQSPSSPDRWYRVLLDRSKAIAGETVLSCDCVGWKQDARNLAARRALAAGRSDADLRVPRGCKHTDAAQALLGSPNGTAMPRYRTDHPYIGATRTRWAPLREFVPEDGWGLQEARITVSDEPYHLVLMGAASTTGTTATAAVAFASCHPTTLGSRAAPVGDWGGYTIAASFCRQAGVPLAGEPPLHFAEELSGRGTTRRATPQPGSTTREILAIGDQRDLGDGLTPAQRAENTLRLFLGPQHALLERQGFLDVSSGLYPGRVYRLRRDAQRRYERRVRVFENQVYSADYCIVRAQSVPEADQFLTVYFGLIADERRVLSVVQRGNIFGAYSDGHERETVPAVWRPRSGQAAVA